MLPKVHKVCNPSSNASHHFLDYDVIIYEYIVLGA